MSTSCLFICFLLAVTFCNTASSHFTATIAPTAPTKESLDSGQYLTLTQYLNIGNVSAVFNTSNTTIEFLPGEHEVSGLSVKQLVVSGVRNIAWRGFSAKLPVLKCKQEFAFVFKEVIDLSLTDLIIHSCGFSNVPFGSNYYIRQFLMWAKRENAAAALLLDNVVSVSIINMTIQNCLGYGLLAVNMLGVSVIESSTFSENNIQTETNNGAGGNALILYSDDHFYSTQTDTVYLMINNCYFLNGSNGFKSMSAFHANGFGLIVYRYDLEIHVFVKKVIFSGNNKNVLLPSVSIVDYQASMASIVITNCTFRREGSLNILLSSKFPSETHFIKIESCLFSQGVGAGIGMYLVSPSNHQNVIVDNCIFENYRSQRHAYESVAVLQVQQVNMVKNCPQVKVFRSNFRNNHITTSEFLLVAKQWEKQACPAIVISNCTYVNNHSPEAYLVYFRRSEDPSVWFLEWTSFVHEVKFINATFINNSLSIESYKGIVGLKDVYASFSGCLFFKLSRKCFTSY